MKKPPPYMYSHAPRVHPRARERQSHAPRFSPPEKKLKKTPHPP